VPQLENEEMPNLPGTVAQALSMFLESAAQAFLTQVSALNRFWLEEDLQQSR
jgi:hypothetical protein